MADVTGFGLVVFDLHRLKSWRIENKLMFPDPDFGTFTIAGESFDLMDGILGMTLSPKTNAGRNNLAKTFGNGYNGNNYIQSGLYNFIYKKKDFILIFKQLQKVIEFYTSMHWQVKMRIQYH